MKTIQEKREYNKLWMRKFRGKKRIRKLEIKKQCPVCGLIMRPRNESLHKGCPYYDSLRKSEDLLTETLIDKYI